MAKKDEFKKYLSRRMWTEQGVVYFCRICGEYLPENQFYKRNDTPFKIDSRCKIHYSRKEDNDNGEMDYFKLNSLTENDFVQTQIILEKMGYKFGIEESVHEQFLKKYKITGDTNGV
jgi:hypothetical protein